MRLRATRLFSISNGGVRRSRWTPAALGSSLALWLDANDASTITLNGSTVSQWRDKSGSGRHVSQATAANQPTYQATGLNGPSIAFSTSFLASSSWSGLISGLSGLTVSSVIKGTSGTLINTANNNGQQFSIESNGGFWINNAAPVFVPFTSQLDIQNYIFNAGTREGYRNGTLLQTTTATPNTINTFDDSNVEIGRRAWYEQFLVANLSEILVFRSALSTTDRQRLEGYLAWKWGLQGNLPSGHPFKNTPPTF